MRSDVCQVFLLRKTDMSRWTLPSEETHPETDKEVPAGIFPLTYEPAELDELFGRALPFGPVAGSAGYDHVLQGRVSATAYR